MQPCEQKETIELMKKDITIFKTEQDKLIESVLEYHKDMRAFIESAQPVIKAFDNISTAGDIVSKTVYNLAKLAVAVGAIIGGVMAVLYALKEWINKP